MYLKTSLKYLLAAIFIFIPLYPKFPLFTVPGSSVAVRAEDFLLLFTSALAFISYLFTKKKNIPPLTFQVITFFIVGLLSVFSASFLTQTVSLNLSLLHLFRRIEYLSAFFITWYVAKDSLELRYFYLLLIILPSVGVLLYGLAQIYLGAPVISTMNAEFSKGIALTLQPGVQLSSTFAGHYDLAIYLVMIMSFAVSFISTSKGKIRTILSAISFISLLWLFMQAGSRISLFSIYLVIGYICFIYRKYVIGVILMVFVTLGILTSSNLVSRLQNIIKIIPIKVENVIFEKAYAADVIDRQIQQDRSTSIRLDVEWPMAIRSLLNNPFLGTGYSSLGLATDNDYLRSIGETGLLGFAAFLAIIISLFKKLFIRKYPKNNMDKLILVSSQAVFIGFLTAGLFLDVFESSKIAIMFWIISGLGVSVKS